MAPHIVSLEFRCFKMKRKSRWDVRPEDLEKNKKTEEVSVKCL